MLEQTSFPFASLIVPVNATSQKELTVEPVSCTMAYGDHGGYYVNRSSLIWWLFLGLAAIAGIYYWWYTQKEAAKKLLIEQNHSQITPLVQT